MTAAHCETGERYIISVDMKGSAGEIEALRQLAEKLGISLEDGQ